MPDKKQKPLVYACSGCSMLARVANDLAIVMDREGLVEMSCIAGVGARLKKLVTLAKSGRPILAMDGCELCCVKKTLALHHVEPTWHINLGELGIDNNDGEICSVSGQYRLLNYTYDLLGLIPAKNIEEAKQGKCAYQKPRDTR